MSRSLSAALTAHLSGAALSLATCLKITRLDGAVLGLTDFDRPLLFNGVNYDPLDGVGATSLRASAGTGIDSLEVTGLLSSARITDTDLLGGRYDNAAVELFQVNWTQNPITDRILIVAGYLGSVTYEGSGFHAELRGLSQRLSQQIGEQTSATCRVFQLGDSRCKLKLGAVALSGVTQANPALVTTATAHGRAVGDPVYFQSVGGMTALNGNVYVVGTVPSATTFTLNSRSGGTLNSTGFAAYTTGGQIGWEAVRSVASVQSAFAITFGSDTNAPGFYTYGQVSFTSGANKGIAREVKSHTLQSGAAAVVLQEPFPFAVAVGDTATLQAGCDRTVANCNGKFANMVNFRGENSIPGTDSLLRRGRR